MEKPLIADFTDERNRVDWWYDRLYSLDVNTPETFFQPIQYDHGTPTLDYREVVSRMYDMGWRQSFLRTMHKSAIFDLQEGSIIHNPKRLTVVNTFANLVKDHIKAELPMGDKVAVRDFIFIPNCWNNDHFHTTEVRYFIRDGEVLYSFPDMEHIRDVWKQCDEVGSAIVDRICDAEPPDDKARQVANEFDQYAWHVDFNIDAHGNWWCVEMGLDSVRWDEDMLEWQDLSEHGKDEYKQTNIFANELQEIKPS